MYKPYGFSKIDATDYAPDIKTLVLNQFLGVDFTRGEFITDNRRSPDAKNVIWGTNPYLFDTRSGKKRITTSKIIEGSSYAKCNGIHVYEPYDDVIVHFGTKLYLIRNDDLKDGGVVPADLNFTLADSKTKSFMSGGQLYIIGAGKYIVIERIVTNTTANYYPHEVQYDGTNPYTNSFSHIPTTVISRLPTGGGTAYEDINLLNTWRKNEFRSTYHSREVEQTITGDGSTTEFSLEDTRSPSEIKWITADDIIVKKGDDLLKETTDYTYNRTTDKITFTTAPLSTDTIKVTFYIDNPNNRLYYDTYQLDSAPIDCKAIVVKKKVDGEWTLVETTDYSVDYENGIVTFVNAPTPEVEGVDNIQITFSVSSGDTATETDTFSSTGQDTFYMSPEKPIILGDKVTVYVGETPQTEGSNNDYVLDILNKKIVFQTGHIPASGDTVTITYNTTNNTRDKLITNCTTFGIFGGSNDTRFFLTGNEDYPNTDWQSGLYDATYFPDTGYTKIGNDNAKIMGYIKQYDTQMIIKESNQQDGSAYLRTFSLDSDGKAYFPVEQGSVGIGAINKDTFAYLGSSPLFLSTDGVMRVSGSNVDNQRLMLNVSEKINSKLIYETNLDSAVGIEYKDQYFLFINGHCYVCDTRMQYKDSINVTEYEWMYWDNMKCQSVGKTDKYLLIGCDGMLYRMKVDGETNRFIEEYDDGTLHDIDAYWTTPKMYLGGITAKKKLRDVFLMYGERDTIRCQITAIFDNERYIDLGKIMRARRLDFSDLNFADFSFNSQITSTTTKIRVMLENFDNVSFKFQTYIGDTPVSASLGMDLFQITYNYKNR